MTNVAGGTQARAKKIDPIRKSSDVEALREGISDLGDSVSDMASRHDRNADEATLAINETLTLPWASDRALVSY